MIRRAYQIGAACLLALSVAANPCAAQPQTLEYPIKAQFLHKFTPFIEWPDTAFEQPNSPMVLCVVGRDPFGAALDRATAGQRLGPRPFVVRRLTRIDAASGCHLAYLSTNSEQTPGAALQALRGAAVVTVTDDAVASGTHGVIHFVIRDSRVRFIINATAAAHGGVQISSKLLALGVSQ